MRCVQDKRFCYIFNPWSDGIREFRGEPLTGLSFRAMRDAASGDPDIASRVSMLRYRVIEELYDLKSDPSCLTNLAGEGAYQSELFKRHQLLRDWMARTGDRALSCFEQRHNREVCGAFLQSLETG